MAVSNHHRRRGSARQKLTVPALAHARLEYRCGWATPPSEALGKALLKAPLVASVAVGLAAALPVKNFSLHMVSLCVHVSHCVPNFPFL